MVTLGENWILSNTRGLALIQNTKYTVHVPDDLRMDRSYLVMANHQSWVDIVVLQTIKGIREGKVNLPHFSFGIS